MKRLIILSSKNANKLKEFQKAFAHYDIDVSLLYVNMDSKKEMAKLFRDKPELIAVLKEETKLKSKKYKYEIVDLAKMYNQSTLEYITRDNLKIKKIKSKKIKGRIDLSRRNSDNINVFGWDDIFVIEEINKTMFELSKINEKISARNDSISKFIEAEIYYKDRLDLNFNKMSQKQTIEIGDKVIDFIKTNKYLNLYYSRISFRNIFINGLNNGAFFKSSKNRREKNYWLPGLNAGIPLVAKKDEIHEITFAVHDLCHFVIPDLIVDTDNKEKENTYILYRMLSEAITMVYADMLFIDMLKENNVEYDYSARKIYPIFEKIKELNPDIEIKKVLIANAMYCIFEDESYYKELMGGEDISLESLSILKSFRTKYEKFFIEDFKWTKKNYDNLIQNKNIQNWSIYFKEELKTQELELLSEKETFLSNQQALKNKVLEIIDEFQYKFEKLPNLSKNKLIANSFKKYLLGQSVIFFKYSFVPKTDFYLSKIKNFLKMETYTEQDILKIRKFYNEYIKLLYKKNLIDLDEKLTYMEIYPLFDAFYVFYERETEEKHSLRTTSKSILKF